MTRATRPAPPPRRVFRDRREAGKILAQLLTAYRGKEDVADCYLRVNADVDCRGPLDLSVEGQWTVRSAPAGGTISG